MVEKLRRQLNEPWRHIVSARTGNNERYAFLYRSDRVDLIDGSAKLVAVPEAAVFDRAPFVASFRAGQFDFMLLTVHLMYSDAARRKSEVHSLRMIATQLEQLGAEHDVIVLGDFNEQHQRPNLQMFEEWGWKKLNDQTTNLGSSEVYDNILIDPKFTREWTGQAGTWRFDELDYANDDHAASELVSDHRPAWAEFSPAGPDDD
jgi:endonuclease/exonuclease/phosphatase family metal-dependent hydrolase